MLKPLVIHQKSFEVGQSESASREYSHEIASKFHVNNDIASIEYLANLCAIIQSAETRFGAKNEICQNG